VLKFLADLPRCTVAMEACASAHHWARAVAALGHAVKLIPPVYVKPFVKRQKNDMADAEAIAEAATRPTMRFVAVKSEEQQAMAMAYRTRDLLVRQRTQTINALRGHLAEYGVVAPAGVRGVPHRSPVGRGNAQHALQATDGCKAMVAFVPRQHP
jgi:transposase